MSKNKKKKKINSEYNQNGEVYTSDKLRIKNHRENLIQKCVKNQFN